MPFRSKIDQNDLNFDILGCFGGFEVLKDSTINAIFTWYAKSAPLMCTSKPVKVVKTQIRV